jgi:Reverse transcriptase (RNA-dependent DNA polymerase)
MDTLINHSQITFIKGRCIFDNIVCAQEILHQVRQTKTKEILFKLDYEKAFDNVNYSFLIKVLKARGFCKKWTDWIMNLLVSGQTSLNINGYITPYFKCKKGLRQGDPLSPFLFNLVADTLSTILSRAKTLGYITGLGNFEGNNLINLNFADDTLIFLAPDSKIIDAFKLLLLGFENLSGLKINFTKSEIVPLNLTKEEGIQYNNILGCKVSSFSITYLGVPLHWYKLKNKD